MQHNCDCFEDAQTSIRSASRELQPGVRHHPQAQRVPPVGQPALRSCLHPEGPAEEEEVPRCHFPHQLPGDGVHGGLPPRCAGGARNTQGQPGRYARYTLC